MPSCYIKKLFLNYRVITPLVSFAPPAIAYKINRVTGSIGKTLNQHTSYLYETLAAPPGIESLMNILRTDASAAKDIVAKFFLFETRLELENLWLIKNKIHYLPYIIDDAAILRIKDIIKKNGPLLILSAHTVNYIMLLWALSAQGIKLCFMMTDPRPVTAANRVLQKSAVNSLNALLKIMPVLFTNEGNTVQKSIELMKKGYTLVMLLDVPAYRGRGAHVRMLNDDIWIPTGCQAILNNVRAASAAFAFCYADGFHKAYRVSFSLLDTPSEIINLQDWADGLENILKASPESWYGWFYFRRMQ